MVSYFEVDFSLQLVGQERCFVNSLPSAIMFDGRSPPSSCWRLPASSTCRSSEGRNPKFVHWVPAFAGMTEEVSSLMQDA